MLVLATVPVHGKRLANHRFYGAHSRKVWWVESLANLGNYLQFQTFFPPNFPAIWYIVLEQ